MRPPTSGAAPVRGRPRKYDLNIYYDVPGEVFSVGLLSNHRFTLADQPLLNRRPLE
jgi:hypothetical protein